MNDYLIFADIDTRDYNVAVFDLNTDGAPGIDQNSVSIPGRDGDLVLTQSRFQNVPHEYMGVIYKDFERQFRAFRDALSSKRGYQRLVDTIHPDEFYLARYKGEFEPKIPRGRGKGKFSINFDRKPQRYLVSGETTVTVASGGSLVNPTNQKSQPLIRVTGYGTLVVGEYTMTIATGYQYIDIDCELMDCYHGTDNANELVTITGNDFPVLAPGSNGVTYSGNITKVEITPRWWRA